ncbi:MAG: tRNA dihydrouridine synthase DusB [Planctomycetota bacterium]|nr:tRNA dihydrouridine synthase DusB [Planctomycetota bacterium]MDA1213886.1 tRNA dihydrouridine synthase DusB [Planctomycetota bacterium]
METSLHDNLPIASQGASSLDSRSAEVPFPTFMRKIPPLQYGSLSLKTRFLLAPLAGYTNLPFRRIVRELGGVGLATTDLVNARGLLTENPGSTFLISTAPDDSPLSVQIFGNEPSVMAEAAQYLEARGYASIDINMGCPVDRITKGGAGASMMCRVDQTIGLVQCVVEAVRIPVTVKMRLGWDETQLTAPRFAREFEQVGVAAITIHGRTRAQGFSGTVDRDGIRQVVAAVDRIPVIGNGDIRSIADAERMFRETGCQGIAIGRGALANPWFFRQLSEWETTGTVTPPGGFDDRLSLLHRQFLHLEELLGAHKAVSSFRKMGHWYLKSMRVRSALRHQFQMSKTKPELLASLEMIRQTGPAQGDRHGTLDDMHIPVPAGPNERW